MNSSSGIGRSMMFSICVAFVRMIVLPNMHKAYFPTVTHSTAALSDDGGGNLTRERDGFLVAMCKTPIPCEFRVLDKLFL